MRSVLSGDRSETRVRLMLNRSSEASPARGVRLSTGVSSSISSVSFVIFFSGLRSRTCVRPRSSLSICSMPASGVMSLTGFIEMRKPSSLVSPLMGVKSVIEPRPT